MSSNGSAIRMSTEGGAGAGDVTVSELRKRRIQLPSPLRDQCLELLPYSVFWKDRDGRFLGCNAKFLKDVGLEWTSELIGKSDADMPHVRSEQVEFFIECDRQVMASGKPLLNVHETQRRADGREVHLLTSKIPLCSESGEVIGILGTYMEFPVRATRDELIEHLSHELNNPLAAILLQAETMLKLTEDSTARKAFELIVKNTKRCARTLATLLVSSRR